MTSNEATLFDLVSNFDKWEDRLAVIFDNGEDPVSMVTYQQLFTLAEKVNCIIQKHADSPDIIGLCLEPSQYVPAIILGVLKGGNAFLNFEASILQYHQSVIDQLKVNILLVESSKLDKLHDIFISNNYCVELVNDITLMHMDLVIVKLNRKDLRRKRAPLAYCITTSGTTGKPKIIKVPHSCIVPNITYQREFFKVKEDDVIFLSSPLTFDPSIVDIFVTLSSGGCLLITSDSVKMIPSKLLQVLMHYSVTVMQCTPTLISRFSSRDLYDKHLGNDSSLRVLGLGGEKFPALSLLTQCRAPRNTTKFYNLYGVTEVSCWSSIYEVTNEDFREMLEDIPIGTPITDTVFVVKDNEGQTVTNGRGILHIRSTKRVCYIDNEDESVCKGFVLRSTGDIVQVDSKGCIIYIGREDTQIKRNGKRLDLTEIEQVVYKLPDVSHCKAIYKEGSLVLAVVPEISVNNHTTSMPDIAASSDASVQKSNFAAAVTYYIKGHLPSHYWPDQVFPVDFLPMTKHGKCDTDALWEAAFVHTEVNCKGQDLKDILSDMWKDATGRKDTLNTNDIFIHSGGNSFQALQLANRIQAYMNMQLPWLLDLILHKYFCDVLKALQNAHDDKHKYQNYNVTEKNDNTVRQIAKKRKYDNTEQNFEDLNQLSEKELSEIDSARKKASIKCMMTSVSRCNKCFDWFINYDDTVSDFLYWGKDLYVWKRNFENMVNWSYSLGGKTTDVKNNSNFMENDRNIVKLDWKKTITKFELSEKWKCDTGKCVDASPLISSLRDGRMVVYIGSHSHTFSAILLDTGQLLWETTLNDRIESSACITLDGRFVVVGCYDYYLYALDSFNGDIWMKYKVGGEVKSSPTVDPITSLVIFGSHDHCIHAVNIETKTAIWCTNIDEGSIFASPCIAVKPHVVLCATLGGVVASLNGDTGAVLWKYRCLKPVFSSTMLTNGGVCFGCVNGVVYHLNFLGEIIWTYTTEAPIFSSPTVVDNFIYIGSHDCHMYCLSYDGELVWKVKVPSPVYSSGFSFTLIDKFKRSIDNRIETVDDNNTLTFASTVKFDNDNVFNMSNVQHSKIIQKEILKSEVYDNAITSDLQICSKKESGNHLYQEEDSFNVNSRFLTFASTDGHLYCVNSYTGEIICQYKFQGEVFSSPVVYQNKIIIGCRNDLVYSLEINKIE